MYLFLSQKEWQSSIPCRVLYLFWQENVLLCIARSILSPVACLFPKHLVPAMCSFKDIIIFREYSQSSLFSMVLCIFPTLKFGTMQFCQRAFFQHILEHQPPLNKLRIEAAIFSEQHRLYWNESSQLKQLTFRRKVSSEYVAVWSSYSFLVTISWQQIYTVSDQRHLKDKYFFSWATLSG